MAKYYTIFPLCRTDSGLHRSIRLSATATPSEKGNASLPPSLPRQHRKCTRGRRSQSHIAVVGFAQEVTRHVFVAGRSVRPSAGRGTPSSPSDIAVLPSSRGIPEEGTVTVDPRTSEKRDGRIDGLVLTKEDEHSPRNILTQVCPGFIP